MSTPSTPLTCECVPSSPTSPNPTKHNHQMTPPSPLVTRRMRTASLCERAASGPNLTGTVLFFCRQKGHGFVTPKDGGSDLFFHVTDVDGEFAPHDGDEVSYKVCPIPPKFEKTQATHIVIRQLAPGVKHEKWTEPPTPHQHPHPSPNIPERRMSISKEELEQLKHAAD